MTKEEQAQKAANEYAEEREKITKDRLNAWSSAPGLKIGSFSVYPLSLRSMIDLELSGNAFFTGNQILHGDIAAYIWRHHPHYDVPDPKYFKNEKRFFKKVGKETEVSGLIEEIQDHYESAFLDNPLISKFGGVSQNNKIPPIPAVASICHEYGSAYGVNPDEVADMDLRIVFQCCRAIRSTQGDAKFSEPDSLRKLKSEYLKAKNG